MQYINPIISDINTRIATANGLYETTKVDPVTGATKYYLHNQQDLDDSDIQIVFSDLGIMLTADAGANWYGLEANGTMLASILNTNGINADWIRTGAFEAVSGATTVFKLDATNKTMEWNLPYSSLDTYGQLKMFDGGDTDDASIEISDSNDKLKTFLYANGVQLMHDRDNLNALYENHMTSDGTRLSEIDYVPGTDKQSYTEYTLSMYSQILSMIEDTYVNGSLSSRNTVLEINGDTGTYELNGNPIATVSTPTFTAASGVTVSKQTWSKVGNVVTGDLTLSKNAAISTTTVSLGTLSEHPGHTVIANARTATVQMRASIDSSGVIHINSPSSVAANTTIYVSLSFVAA